ncbi:hypothetical protein [Acidimangrovimonas pyrenivorans]|uniref:Uncharacterized protein n=1 Tax=Acidimangrovimonas pyrenivorans TaxID=2030798 RepID=A0ABV7AN94_9RHOB
MNIGASKDAGRGHALARMAAQWLTLIRFQANKAAPIFSPSVSHYHDMLDPSADETACFKACKNMRRHVQRHMQLEQMKGEEAYMRARPVDPYSAHWKTTRHGAELTAIAWLLKEAMQEFESTTDNVDR